MHDIARGLRALWAPVVFIGGMILVLRLPNLTAVDAISMVLSELGIGITFGRMLARKLFDPQVAEEAFNASIVMAPSLPLIWAALSPTPVFERILARPLGSIVLLVLAGVLIFTPLIYARVRWGIRDCRPLAREWSQAKD